MIKFLGTLLLVLLATTGASSQALPPSGPPIPSVGSMCGQTAHAHFTTAADTVILNLATGKSTYICDYEFSSAGITNIFLETSASNSCTSPTGITQTFYGVAGTNKTAPNAFYRGISGGAGLALCVNSTGAGVVGDVTIYYIQE